MQLDLTNPVIQGALVALGGVILAALAGLLGAIIGAAIGAKAARETAKITQTESQATRQEAREQWYREKGVAAAEAILDLMIELDLNQFSYYSAKLRESRERTGHAEHPEPDQGELEPFYARIRRHAHAIKDESVRGTMLAMADCLFGYRSIEAFGGGRATEIWHQLLRETEAVLGAYIRGDAIPEAPGIRNLEEILKDYWETTSG